MIKLSPSILAADFANLGDNIKKIDEAGAPYVHVDIMDGAFVPSISMGMPVVKSIRKVTDKVFDVHLMIEEPIRYLADFKDAGADIITVHEEACSDLSATIAKIRELGMQVGVSIKPGTPVEKIVPYLEDVDMILLMTVEPGFGGQKYIDAVTDKIVELRKIVTERGLDIDIQVDGGVYTSNVRTVLDAGANVIVAGSAVFKDDIKANVQEFLDIFKEYEGRL